MLVATPANLVDRKPRVISEIRKPFVQRSPSLDDLPRLSGVLNYYCDILGIWSQKQVCVRDGCLLVYQDTPSFPQITARGYASLGRPANKRTPLQHTRSDSSGTPSGVDFLAYSGSQSLGRARGAILAGLEFRLPLRHLNLMQNALAPLAFTLSHQYKGNENAPRVTFQALNELDYDRWVKTLAVEIMRQTPLDAIRFLDVLGIASLSTPSTKCYIPSPLLSMMKPTPTESKTNCKNISQTMVRWDRSPSSEGSTTSADYSIQEYQCEGIQCVTSRPKRLISNIGHCVPRRKLCMKDADSDRDDQFSCGQMGSTGTRIITSGRKSREKVRRYRDKNGNGSSSEEARTIDEGIVIEERGSSSERSCRRTLWPSDRSDCLDSPHSVSSYSSCELCESPETISLGDDDTAVKKDDTAVISCDEPDCRVKDIIMEQISERIYSKNIVSPKSFQKNLLKRKCDKKVATGRSISEEKKLFLETMSRSNDECWKKTKLIGIPLFRAQPCNVTEVPAIPEEIQTELDSKLDTHSQSSNTINLSNNAVNDVRSVHLQDNTNNVWSRARSCSPKNRSPAADERGARALSAGQPPSSKLQSCVEMLRQRCQNSENYVPVREKLALFESLCHVGRLARSSEELSGDLSKSIAPRTRSLHDLSRERSPHVREMCEFFERFGQQKAFNNSGDNERNRSNPNLLRNVNNTSNWKENNERTKSLDYKGSSSVQNNIYKEIYVRNPSTYTSTSSNKLTINTMKYKVKCQEIKEKECENNYNNTCYDSLKAVNMKIENDSSLCDAFQYGQFKQIRMGNKIITYV